jgi:hypothetical protein
MDFGEVSSTNADVVEGCTDPPRGPLRHRGATFAGRATRPSSLGPDRQRSQLRRWIRNERPLHLRGKTTASQQCRQASQSGLTESAPSMRSTSSMVGSRRVWYPATMSLTCFGRTPRSKAADARRRPDPAPVQAIGTSPSGVTVTLLRGDGGTFGNGERALRTASCPKPCG